MASITLTPPRSQRTDEQMVTALRAGDEESFATLVDECQPLMMRLARSLTPSRTVAEQVVHDTWLGVLRGLDDFGGRSTLRAWIVRALVDGATARREREPARALFASSSETPGGPAVDPDRFLPDGHPTFPGHWATAPPSWDGEPKARLLRGDMGDLLRDAIDALPDGPRTVVTLRDVEGWSPEEVCDALDLSAADQRVLLHRARTTLRRTIELGVAADA